MTTAAQIITAGLRLFGIIDQADSPQPVDIANGVQTLTNLLRNEQADGACQYLIKRVKVVLPIGVLGQPYSFSIGTADPSYLVQVDAVAMRSMWLNDINLTVNRTTRIVPISDVVRTTYPGIVTKWSPERQSDGSVKINAWQPPRAASPALIEYGGRFPALTAADGSDTVALPPEGIHDATLLFGRTVCASYGRSLEAVGLPAQDAQRVNDRWRDWARGQQWLQFVRS